MARDEARHGEAVEMVEKLDGHIKAECRMKKGRKICPFLFASFRVREVARLVVTEGLAFHKIWNL